jgi:phosphoribosylformylglycinamidine (FGAM) synthase-like enzyme
MEPFEIMVSESQERMLCVVEPDLVGDVIAVCERWETLARRSAQVTDAAACRSSTAARWSASCRSRCWSTTARCTTSSPRPPTARSTPRPAVLRGGEDAARSSLLALLASPTSPRAAPCSSSTTRSSVAHGAPPRAKPTRPCCSSQAAPAIAISIDGNGRRVACDPRAGAAEAVYECAANLACVGAEPLGLTNCLNFGNPEKPHVAWQLTEAVEGLARGLRGARRAGRRRQRLALQRVARRPDPADAGRRDGRQAARRAAPAGSASPNAGDAIALVGPSHPRADGSELAKLRGVAPGGAGCRSRSREPIRRRACAVRDGVRSGALSSAHDIAEGGIAVALAECCIAGGIGATLKAAGGLEPFGEAPEPASSSPGPRRPGRPDADHRRGRRRRARRSRAARGRVSELAPPTTGLGRRYAAVWSE